MKKSFDRGVTFIELIVVIAIFGIIAGIILFNYSGFDSNIKLQNIMNDIATTVKSAQISGSSGKFDTRMAGAGTIYRPTYGVYFKKETPPTSDYFVYFVDAPVQNGGTNDFVFDAVTEQIKRIDFLNGFKINKICYDVKTPSINGSSCDTSATAQATAIFTRPDLFAYLPDTTGGRYNDINITVEAPNGMMKTLVIYASGAMSIE